MAERKFDYNNVSNVYNQMKSINSDIKGLLENIDTEVEKNVNVEDEAIFGDLGAQLLLSWENISSDFPEFMDNFDNWAALVAKASGDYSQFERDIAGFKEANPLGVTSKGITQGQVSTSSYNNSYTPEQIAQLDSYARFYEQTGAEYIDTGMVAYAKKHKTMNIVTDVINVASIALSVFQLGSVAKAGTAAAGGLVDDVAKIGAGSMADDVAKLGAGSLADDAVKMLPAAADDVIINTADDVILNTADDAVKLLPAAADDIALNTADDAVKLLPAAADDVAKTTATSMIDDTAATASKGFVMRSSTTGNVVAFGPGTTADDAAKILAGSAADDVAAATVKSSVDDVVAGAAKSSVDDVVVNVADDAAKVGTTTVIDDAAKAGASSVVDDAAKAGASSVDDAVAGAADDVADDAVKETLHADKILDKDGNVIAAYNKKGKYSYVRTGYERAKQAGQTAKTNLGNAWNTAKDKASSFGHAAKDKVVNVASGAKDKVVNWGSNIKSNVKTGWTNTKNYVNSIPRDYKGEAAVLSKLVNGTNIVTNAVTEPNNYDYAVYADGSNTLMQGQNVRIDSDNYMFFGSTDSGKNLFTNDSGDLFYIENNTLNSATFADGSSANAGMLGSTYQVNLGGEVITQDSEIYTGYAPSVSEYADGLGQINE